VFSGVWKSAIILITFSLAGRIQPAGVIVFAQAPNTTIPIGRGANQLEMRSGQLVCQDRTLMLKYLSDEPSEAAAGAYRCFPVVPGTTATVLEEILANVRGMRVVFARVNEPGKPPRTGYTFDFIIAASPLRPETPTSKQPATGLVTPPRPNRTPDERAQGGGELNTSPSGFPTIIGLLLLGGCLLVIVSALARLFRAMDRRRARKTAGRRAAEVIAKNMPSLIRRREQLVRVDAYGKQRIENWIKEISYFIEQHIVPTLTPHELAEFQSEKVEVANAIYTKVEIERVKNPALSTFSDDMTPNEFEYYCAQELRRAGWDARVTLQSRDQGVDVVAVKNGTRVVLQCKLYSRPVGNKAVQEAAAARAHEQADVGIVVSNHRYTQDAEALAQTNRILLLHYTDLSRLDEIIGLNSFVR
jgi:HJR/Mrr/RecB family endonuclease